MRFLFVDAVTLVDGDRIAGRRRFPVGEPLRYPDPQGTLQVAPGVVSEAIGQLASWLCLARNGFTARPVFLFADRITVAGPVRPGDEVELSAVVTEQDSESLRFSGTARVGGRTLVSVKDCSGYFLPLAELEDPAVTRERYAALTGGGLVLAGHEGDAYSFASLAGETVELEPGVSVRTRTTMGPDEPFYADHFPRFPVTPIVVLNELIGAATARVFGLTDPGRLQARQTSGVKIRSFIRPGDTCETVVRIMATHETDGVRSLSAVAEVLKDGRRILRGVFDYDFLG